MTQTHESLAPTAQESVASLGVYLERLAVLIKRGVPRAEVYATSAGNGHEEFLGHLAGVMTTENGVYCVLRIANGEKKRLIPCHHRMLLPENVRDITEFRDWKLGIIIVFPPEEG